MPFQGPLAKAAQKKPPKTSTKSSVASLLHLHSTAVFRLPAIPLGFFPHHLANNLGSYLGTILLLSDRVHHGPTNFHPILIRYGYHPLCHLHCPAHISIFHLLPTITLVSTGRSWPLCALFSLHAITKDIRVILLPIALSVVLYTTIFIIQRLWLGRQVLDEVIRDISQTFLSWFSISQKLCAVPGLLGERLKFDRVFILEPTPMLRPNSATTNP